MTTQDPTCPIYVLVAIIAAISLIVILDDFKYNKKK